MSVASSGGFTPFWVGPFSTNRTEIEISVVADNRFDEANRTVTQHASYGFYQYGGILRAVTLHELPPSAAAASLYLRRAETRIVDAAGGTVNISAFVAALATGQRSQVLPPRVVLALSWGDSATVTKHEVKLGPGGEAVLLAVVHQPRQLWTVDPQQAGPVHRDGEPLSGGYWWATPGDAECQRGLDPRALWPAQRGCPQRRPSCQSQWRKTQAARLQPSRNAPSVGERWHSH